MNYTAAQIDAELKAAVKRKQADLDLIVRACNDIVDMDDRIETFLKARSELTPGRHRAATA